MIFIMWKYSLQINLDSMNLRIDSSLVKQMPGNEMRFILEVHVILVGGSS